MNADPPRTPKNHRLCKTHFALLFPIVLLAACGGSPAQPPPECPKVSAEPPKSPPVTVAALEEVHQRLVEAYRTNDVAKLERLLAPDHVHNNVFGMVQGKEALLGDMRAAVLVFKAYEITSSHWFTSGDFAIVTGTLHAAAERAGKLVPAQDFRFTRVFERRGGEWLELLFHNTIVPPSK